MPFIPFPAFSILAFTNDVIFLSIPLSMPHKLTMFNLNHIPKIPFKLQKFFTYRMMSHYGPSSCPRTLHL